MLNLVKFTLYIFVVIVALTAMLVLSGLAWLWFAKTPGNLPYLGWLLSTLIAELIAIVVILARKGLKYLPDVKNHKKEADTLSFMKDFIASGSTVQIVTNRFAWIENSPTLLNEVASMAQNGTLIEVITPGLVIDSIRTVLENAGVHFIVTNEKVFPDARFTLINGNRGGAERLAIARGTHPDHEVTIFDNHSGPQIIGMAKDIIRKSKEMANA
jgi:hypothetical protein